MPARTTARMAAFIPGASPPEPSRLSRATTRLLHTAPAVAGASVSQPVGAVCGRLPRVGAGVDVRPAGEPALDDRSRHEEFRGELPGLPLLGGRGGVLAQQDAADRERAGPAGVEGFFREAGLPARSLTLPPPGEPSRTMEEVVAIATSYGQEFIGPPLPPRDRAPAPLG